MRQLIKSHPRQRAAILGMILSFLASFFVYGGELHAEKQPTFLDKPRLNDGFKAPCAGMAPMERRVCLEKDNDLSERYLQDLQKEITAELPPKRQDAFQKAYQAWHAWRDANCAFQAEGQALERLSCQALQNHQKTQSLDALLARIRKDPSDPVIFEPDECYGAIEALDQALTENPLSPERQKTVSALLDMAVGLCENGNPALGMELLNHAGQLYDGE